MAIESVKLNKMIINPSFKNDGGYKSYLEAEGAVNTDNNVKPLPPKGHLVDDNFADGVKYFFKDIGYDMKSVRNGYKGVANDHQLGRLNDVGLRLGGIAIAIYLASRTSNPKTRIMEYVGLGTFLTAMNIYPKLAINAPARLLHGYDIDKQYIDDQGRKKSVQQDSNYVPYDMYIGAKKDEDLDFIGDKMGIPRDIKNRHDLIREQMRKIATQNNTLWMLTAGFATPVTTALACCGLENYVVTPLVSKIKNNKTNKAIDTVFNTVSKWNGAEGINAEENELSKSVVKIISEYRDKSLTSDAFGKIAELLTADMSSQSANALKTELRVLLNPSENISFEDILGRAKSCVNSRKPERIQVLIPSAEELERLVNDLNGKYADLGKEEFSAKLKEALTDLIDKKVSESGINKTGTFAEDYKRVIRTITDGLEKGSASKITDEQITKLGDLAKVLGEFNTQKQKIEACKHFKLEADSGTILAETAAKFEREFLKGLGIKYKDLAKMRDSEEYAQKLLDSKLTEISHNEAEFKKFMDKLASVVSETEIKLNGVISEESSLKKLINSLEYLYNGTAKRLDNIGGFGETVRSLIGEDAKSAQVRINTFEDMLRFLDGMAEPVRAGSEADYVREFSRGLGSDKYNALSRIFNRYQDGINTYFRSMHTLDAYRKMHTEKDALNSIMKKYPEFGQKLKDVLLHSNTSDDFNKLYITNGADYYKTLMSWLYEGSSANPKEGIITELTSEALSGYDTSEKGDIVRRFKEFIAKYRNVVGNDGTDTTKLSYKLDMLDGAYSRMTKTETAKSNISGLQNFTEYMRKAAGRKYGTQKWLRIMSGVLAGVLGTAFLAQFSFGKLSNPHNIQRQVKDDSNN